MASVIIQAQGLCKQFGGRGGVLAVDHVDLAVQRGELFGFLGPNGSGKTTTIGMLLGLLHPTAGRVRLFGQPVTPRRVIPLRRVGALAGVVALIPGLSARENLRVLARLHRGVDDRRVDETLDLVGLAGVADRAVNGFSLGMKQRLGLGAALLHRPELLILDEPTNGLDPAGMREFRVLLRALAEQGVTVFLSSHLLHEVEQICHRAAVLSQGRVVAQGDVGTLLDSQAVVSVRVADPQSAARILQGLAGVTRVSVNGDLVQVRGAHSTQVNLHLVQHGIIPSELYSRRADLESVFLELTRDTGRSQA